MVYATASPVAQPTSKQRIDISELHHTTREEFALMNSAKPSHGGTAAIARIEIDI